VSSPDPVRMVTVPADELQKVADDAARMFVIASRMLQAAGVDLAPPPNPAPLPDNVISLDDYRRGRSA
jgi:hypothetical protein